MLLATSIACRLAESRTGCRCMQVSHWAAHRSMGCVSFLPPARAPSSERGTWPSQVHHLAQQHGISFKIACQVHMAASLTCNAQQPDLSQQHFTQGKGRLHQKRAHRNSVVRRKGRVRSSQRCALHHWLSSRGRSRQLCTHCANMWLMMVSLVGRTTSGSSRSLPPAAQLMPLSGSR